MKDFLEELRAYAKERKKYWLVPIIIISVLMGMLVFSAQATLSSPFIYAIF